jgi:hypothetical protein
MRTGFGEEGHEPMFMASGPGPHGPSRNDRLAVETTAYFGSDFAFGSGDYEIATRAQNSLPIWHRKREARGQEVGLDLDAVGLQAQQGIVKLSMLAVASLPSEVFQKGTGGDGADFTERIQASLRPRGLPLMPLASTGRGRCQKRIA